MQSQGYDQMDCRSSLLGMSGIGAQLYTIVDDKSVDINFMPAEFDEVIGVSPSGYYTLPWLAVLTSACENCSYPVMSPRVLSTRLPGEVS